MKKPVNIYIDYVAEDSNDEFAIKLRKHLQGVKFELNITLFSDLEFENVAEEWEVETIKAIEKADIVIPILSNVPKSLRTKKVKLRSSIAPTILKQKEVILPTEEK